MNRRHPRADHPGPRHRHYRLLFPPLAPCDRLCRFFGDILKQNALCGSFDRTKALDIDMDSYQFSGIGDHQEFIIFIGLYDSGYQPVSTIITSEVDEVLCRRGFECDTLRYSFFCQIHSRKRLESEFLPGGLRRRQPDHWDLAGCR